MNLYSLILISFISSSIPWSLILGYVFSKKDIREVGDNNPGGTNALKLSGIKVGLIAIFLDISKAFFPIYIALKNDFEVYKERLYLINLDLDKKIILLKYLSEKIFSIKFIFIFTFLSLLNYYSNKSKLTNFLDFL